MGTGYIRNDTGDNIADGNVINASDLDGEFNALQSAFDNSTGHTHDGTAAEGAPIEKVGPNQEVVVTATVLRPAANNTIDLGVETTNEFKNLYIDGTAYLDSVDIDGGTIDGLSVLTVDNLSLNGNTITSTDTNGNLNLRANGTGIISVDATDVNFGDSDKATFGDGSDLQIYHDGSNNYIDAANVGNLILQSQETDKDIVLRSDDGSGGLADYVTIDGSTGQVKLRHYSDLKLNTTSTGISVTGDVDASDDLILSSDGSKITFGANGDVEITHSHNVGLIFDNTNTSDDQDFVLTLRSNEDTILADEQIARINFSTNSSAGGQAAGTQASIKVDATDTYSATVAGSRMEFHTTTGSGTNTRAMYIDDDQSVVFTGPSANVKLDATNSTLDFPDNFKIMMGASDDLQIYHDGSHSFISDAGTGNLYIKADDLILEDAAGNNYLQGTAGAQVRLYHNNATKLTTASTGVDITGAFTATDGSTITVGDNSVALELISTDTDASQGPILRLTRDAVGAASDVIGTIHYYGEDVAGNGTQYAEIEGRIEDATDGAEDGELVLSTMIAGTSRIRLKLNSAEAVFNDGSLDVDFRVESNGNANMLFVDGGNDRVGIGTAAPNGLLELRAGNGSGTLNIVSTVNAANAGNKIAFFGADRSDTDEEMAYIKPLLVTNSGGSGNVQEGHLTFGTSGSERMRLDSTGKLSLGTDLTNADSSLLHITSGSADNFAMLQLENTNSGSSTAPDIALYRNSASPADDDNIGQLIFYANNSAGDRTTFGGLYYTITDVTDGSEDSRFRVFAQQAGVYSEFLTVGSTAGNTGEVVVNEDSGDINFRVESDSDSAAFFVDGADGNIGMSTSAPSTHIPVSNNSGKRSFVNFFTGGTQFVAGRSDTTVNIGDYIGGYLFKTNDGSGDKFGGMIATADDATGNGNLEFYPVSTSYENGNEGKMQLDDSGDIYLRGGGIKVGRSHGDVYTSSEENVIIHHVGSGSNDTSTQITSRDGTGGDAVFRHIRQGTTKSEIEENGDFLSATNSYTSTSDERLKENIVASGSQWDDIKALQVKKYSMIEDELDAPNMLGVVAQDLQASGMNGLVKQHFKTDTDDNPILDADGNQEEYLSVKYSVLYMKAIKALQEAMAKIEVLETKVAALEAE